jgi:GH25 family lysozyme M1 (1,4-beta-N-acetylmuramidase)
MAQTYQLLVDIWEGNLNLDLPTLLAAGVSGMIVRLNNMNGGHHKDSRFDENWTIAKQMPACTLYFVYNPWVDGKANYAWLAANLPADIGSRRIMVDIEVIKAGYSAATYRTQVMEFLRLITRTNPIAIYTGAWFLDRLDTWPTTYDYWWASYSTSLARCTTWEQYRAKLATLNSTDFTNRCPGAARLWQCSGDGLLLPGFGGHSVDLSGFAGTLKELQDWFGVPETVPATGKYGACARLLHLNERDGAIKPTVLGGYDGAVIWLGDGNSMGTASSGQLNTVVSAGKPALGLISWRFNYTYKMKFDPQAWPVASTDPYVARLDKAMRDGTTQRPYSALIVDVSDVGKNTVNSWMLTDAWLKQFAFLHLQDMLAKYYNIPIYMYFTRSAYALYGLKQRTNIQPYLKGLTQDTALSTVSWVTPGSDGYPQDSASPVLDSKGNPTMDTPYWRFWLYTTKPRWTWLFYTTKDKLYRDLNFTPPAS